MPLNAEFAKKHWPILVGGLVGLFVLYYLYKRGQVAPAATTDLSGGAGAVQNLSAAASLQNAQLNAQVETAAYTANTQNNQIAAALQASLATTAAQLAATQQQTSAAEAVALGGQQTSIELAKVAAGQAVDIQTLQSNENVARAQIESDTLTGIAQTEGQTMVQIEQAKQATALAQISNVNEQINAMFKGSKHFSTDIRAFAPIIALETGQGYAAPQLGAANAAAVAATSPGAVISAAGSVLTDLTKAGGAAFAI